METESSGIAFAGHSAFTSNGDRSMRLASERLLHFRSHERQLCPVAPARAWRLAGSTRLGVNTRTLWRHTVAPTRALTPPLTNAAAQERVACHRRSYGASSRRGSTRQSHRRRVS